MFGFKKRPVPSDFRPVTQSDVDRAIHNIDCCYKRDDGVWIEHFCSYVWTVNERRARQILDEIRASHCIGEIWFEFNSRIEERVNNGRIEYRATINMYKLPDIG